MKLSVRQGLKMSRNIVQINNRFYPENQRRRYLDDVGTKSFYGMGSVMLLFILPAYNLYQSYETYLMPCSICTTTKYEKLGEEKELSGLILQTS